MSIKSIKPRVTSPSPSPWTRRGGKRGARINSLSPGLIDTNMGRQEFAHQEMMVMMLQKTPVGRWGTAEEIAQVAVFLCSEQASFVTGIDILVDGGMTNALMREMRGAS
jgi:NAD(P)-dependent dehydrogenase (short-subunit alcohol dehydrogenase family)